MKPPENKYCYKTNNGTNYGFFNIYQGKNGGIYMMMGNSFTLLTLGQVHALNIDCYSLIDFDHDSHCEFYNVKKPIRS